MAEIVNHPQHYNSGSIEVIDIIKDGSSPDEYEGFLRGNVVKYVLRYKHKNGIQDLKKAKVYLEWLIKHNEEQQEKQERNGTPQRSDKTVKKANKKANQRKPTAKKRTK